MTTNQTCAACKFQRRKCTPSCLLAPYLNQYHHGQFLNAHKLFGVGNITKIIKSVSPSKRDEAMHTIMFQSDARAIDPIQGCCSIIKNLENQIEYTRKELEILHQQLAMFCDPAYNQEPYIQIQEPEFLSSFWNSCDVNNNNNNTTLYGYNLPHVQEPNQQQQQHCSSGDFYGLQEDMWCLQFQDSSTTVEEISSERHDFEHHQLSFNKGN